jgi:hypothetical protein
MIGWLWKNWWNENWQGKPKHSERTRPQPLCPPQVPHHLSWARTRAAAVGSWRLTARAMPRPPPLISEVNLNSLGASSVRTSQRTQAYHKYVIILIRLTAFCRYSDGLDCRDSIPGKGKMFFSSPRRPDRLWPLQPPIQLVPGALSRG